MKIFGSQIVRAGPADRANVNTCTFSDLTWKWWDTMNMKHTVVFLESLI